MAIARTVLRNPPVLIFDEATSSLDTQTEAAVQAELERLAEGRTTITIAHRLSTVRDADQIVVVDQGAIVERGKHEELLERGGFYANLVTRDVAEEPLGVNRPFSTPLYVIWTYSGVKNEWASSQGGKPGASPAPNSSCSA